MIISIGIKKICVLLQYRELVGWLVSERHGRPQMVESIG